ncbi:3'-5' exonuclease [Sphingobium sp. BYY-5]|uniref:3'-5' exonuclease n=1 Tax=Sphingobium sp. BYY-5 TaxID=2926400 RepID=UPI001FA6BE1A|nr:3'-5' exonuclease [Sphingobium sp. BYY-5]MCI4590769.1 3'-5' exonuclease [Sphingobium sp. BYY-5]
MFLSSAGRAHTSLAVSAVDPGAVDFVAVDVETACGRVSSICQIGIVGFRGGAIAFEYETLIDPKDYFSSFNTRIHGITADHVAGKPCFGALHEMIDSHLSGRVTVAHSYFDKGAIGAACRMHDRATIEATWLDSVRVAKRVWPELPSHRLNVVSKHLGIRLKHHDARSDARAAGLIVVKASEATGIPLEGWLTSPKRASAPPAPKPASEGALIGQRIAILGEPRHGELAHRIAAQGGRVVAAVGKTTTMLAVCAEEPFGYIRYDAQFRRARDLQDQGSGLEILGAAALVSRCDGI